MFFNLLCLAGYPRSISADWDGLPSSLDAAFTWTNGKTYFFKVGIFFTKAMINIAINCDQQ